MEDEKQIGKSRQEVRDHRLRSSLASLGRGLAAAGFFCAAARQHGQRRLLHVAGRPFV